VVVIPQNSQWTAEEYKQYEAEMGTKHEMLDGEVFAMVGGTRKHSVITMNVGAELSNQLRDKPCRTHSSDMRVKIDDASYVYPDVSVVCGEEQFEDENETSLLNPTIVIEVLSPSTANYDRSAKRDKYMSLPSLQAYLLVSTERIAVEMYTRQKEGWLLQTFHTRETSVPLASVDVRLPLNEIYRDITFDEPKSQAEPDGSDTTNAT
jgi:Uma2 family endonuclease